MKDYKLIIKRVLGVLFNNILINNLIILFGLEDYFKGKRGYWQNKKILQDKTLQEQVEYSCYPEVQETLEKLHAELRNVRERHFPERAKVLDIGCGVGLFLSDFPESFDLTGIDLSQELVSLARQRFPRVKFIIDDFFKIELAKKFDLIYAISVLQSVSRMNIEKFFKKASNLLETGGILLVAYPHALSFWDILYPDLSYMQYSSLLIEKFASRYLKIIKHHHVFDGRSVGRFDTHIYKYPKLDRVCKNYYLLVAQKNT